MRSSKVLAALAAGFMVLASQGALAEGDAAKGEKVFKKCKTCHSLEAGKKKVGPSLAGVFERTAGTLEGFKFSQAMKDSGIVWNEETLDKYLTKPRKFLKGTKMAFPGLKKQLFFLRGTEHLLLPVG